jgi:hypothetical protein
MRGRRVTEPFEIPKHNGRPQPLGQVIDLLVQDLPGAFIVLGKSTIACPLHDVVSKSSLPCSRAPCACRDALGDAEKPARYGRTAPDRPGPACEHQKNGLKRIVGVVRIAQNTPADPENHRAVADHQLFKGRLGRLIAPQDKPVQELRIGQTTDRADVEKPVHLLQRLVERAARHGFHTPRFWISGE